MRLNNNDSNKSPNDHAKKGTNIVKIRFRIFFKPLVYYIYYYKTANQKQQSTLEQRLHISRVTKTLPFTCMLKSILLVCINTTKSVHSNGAKLKTLSFYSLLSSHLYKASLIDCSGVHLLVFIPLIVFPLF